MVQRSDSRRWRSFWAGIFMLATGCGAVLAAPILIDVSVQYTIYNHNGSPNALADGSVVYVIGSLDSVNNGMTTWGTPNTNLVANSTLGDDVLLATVRIGDMVDPNTGTFLITFQYDSDQANFIYIRFFETTNIPITGLVYYGVSGIQTIPPPEFGIETFVADGNLTTGLVVNLRTNFVVIPEPGTGNLIVMVVGMVWAMRMTMRGRAVRREPPIPGGT